MTHALLVEDKEENLYLLEALLTGHGITVDRARHGAEALVLARLRLPDICISDLLMPVMDGYTLLRQWKLDPKLKRVPFVVYTATYTEPADEKLAFDLGADAFILKPSEPDDLLAQIRQVLEREQVSAPRTGLGPGDETLETYSQALIRKLEEKTLQLEATNVALERDIRDRELAERERALLLASLRASERRFRSTFQSAAVGIAITTAAGRFLEANPAYLEMLGYDEVELRQLDFLSITHPDDREWNREAIDALLRGERENLTFNKRYLRKDGTPLWVRLSVAVMEDVEQGGQAKRLIAVAEDVSELRAADARLRQQAALLDKAQDVIIVRDLDGNVTFWNRSAERLYGWRRDEAVGRHITDLVYRDREQFDRALQAVLATGEWMGELRQRTKDGRDVVVEGRWTLVRDDADQPTSVLTINTDVTVRKAMEQQYLRAQRLESLGTLAGGIAHDLNNVLAPIMMAIDLLREDVRGPEAQATLDLIAASAQRGAQMVKQVLTFARGAEGERRVIDPGDPIRDAASIVRETFPRSIVVETDLDRQLWTIEADPTQLHQVLLNLCVNARDAMPQGGRLRIAAGNLSLDAQYAAMNRDARVGPYVRIDVEDGGVGIPATVIDRIFDPFFTTKEIGQGTGLGLATSLAIVRAHGGFIRVYSEPGRGSRFRLYLPARTEASPDTASAASGHLPHGRGETILVIEDEEAIRHVLERTLSANGYRVLTAADGSEGVSVFVRHKDEIALVLTDMMMPVMDGRATIEVIRRVSPGMKFIGASGLQVPATDMDGRPLLVQHFLPKPFTATSLLRTLREALDE